jgi:hypothetical protein
LGYAAIIYWPIISLSYLAIKLSGCDAIKRFSLQQLIMLQAIIKRIGDQAIKVLEYALHCYAKKTIGLLVYRAVILSIQAIFSLGYQVIKLPCCSR